MPLRKTSGHRDRRGDGDRRSLASHRGFARLAISRAGVTQLAECQLPKLNVAGSNPVSRSTFPVIRRGPDIVGRWFAGIAGSSCSR